MSWDEPQPPRQPPPRRAPRPRQPNQGTPEGRPPRREDVPPRQGSNRSGQGGQRQGQPDPNSDRQHLERDRSRDPRRAPSRQARPEQRLRQGHAGQGRPPQRQRRPRQPRDPRFRPRRDPATFEPPPINHAAEAAKNVGEWAVVVLGAIIVAISVNAFVLYAPWIPSESMTPTLQVGDRVLVNKLAVRFGEVQRGEVVVFHPPEGSQSGSDLIKRAVAIEGDTIESIGGIVHVNGQPLDETYLPPGTTTVDLPETIVPQGHIWVMGDNRGNSEDSRDFRAVPESLVQGEAFMKVWPLGNIGGL